MALSENDIIRRYFAPLSEGAPSAFDLVDDAALIEHAPAEGFVVSMDTLVAGVHFFSDDGAADIAIKVLGVNLSDLAAKAAVPRYYLLSLSLPKEFANDTWLSEFRDGLRETQEKFNCALIGGDTVETLGPLSICITIFGGVSDGKMVRRTGAKAGDRVFVSGTIGDSVLGLALRSDQDCVSSNLAGEQADFLVGRYLRPSPRCELAPLLCKYATAAMDISDGLVGDFRKLCDASGHGALLDVTKVPLSDAAQDWLSVDSSWFPKLLCGGDDYELLFTVSPENLGSFLAEMADVSVQVTEIGEILSRDEGIRFIGAEGVELTLSGGRYEHFQGT